MPEICRNLRPIALPEDPRLREILETHLGFVWRTLRNLGVCESDLEDETQKVFLVLAQHLPSLDDSALRSFLFGTARRIAARSRRTRMRRREAALEDWLESADTRASPEQKAEDSQSLRLLVAILDTMPDEQRETFMLYELEQLTLAEIAELGQVPLGTVASRLRRARGHFQAQVSHLKLEYGGGCR